jgi:hypothetical protein
MNRGEEDLTVFLNNQKVKVAPFGMPHLERKIPERI